MKIKKSNSIIKLVGEKPGKVTTIMVGVHGNELSGVECLDEISKSIEIEYGEVYFIYANLKALKLNKREYEKNMNRCFFKNNLGVKYEDLRAKEIMFFLDKSDYLLDIHNTINKQTSIPFLISEYKELGKYFPVDFVVSGFDKLHPGGSDSYMNSIGKVGLCLESGSIYDSKGKDIALNGILNFLRFTGNIEGEIKIYKNKKFVKFNNIYKNKTTEFKLAKKFKDFEALKSGELIATDGGRKLVSEKDSVIAFAYDLDITGDERFCLGEVI